MSYYDGTKLLSMKDLSGQTPEIFMATGNRSAGKTTYFNKLCVNRFLKNGDKFMLVYRFANELNNIAEKFFSDIHHLFFNDYIMASKSKDGGTYIELMIGTVGNMNVCGYAAALNTADKLKRYSHLFSDVQSMVFDEFMSETNHYAPDELTKLISLHTTVARGRGKQCRYVPLYMMSNTVSLLNPYYTTFNIPSRLKTDTKFLRGDGWVLETAFIESAANALKQSGFNRAFSNHSYIGYATENTYLNDDNCMIERLEGNSRYKCTFTYNGGAYAVRDFPETGLVYVDRRIDETCPIKFAVLTNDIGNSFIRDSNNLYVTVLRDYFNQGLFRFANLECKEATLKFLSY